MVKQQKKKWQKLALYGSIIILAWLVVGMGMASYQRTPVKDFRPILLNEENNQFLAKADLEEVVRRVHGRPLSEIPRGELEIAEIETELRQNPYVSSAEAYTELSGDLVVRLELRKPLARVMFGDGSGFYLDRSFRKMELSQQFAANTLLVRGLTYEPVEPRDSIVNADLEGLREFLAFVDRDEFWRAHFSEVYVEEDGDLILYPLVGDIRVEFGPPTRIEQKFSDLKLFYEQVLNPVGWDKYQQISLKFRGQIVAQKK